MKSIPLTSSFPARVRFAKTYIISHKIASVVILLVVIGVGYTAYAKFAKATTPTRYVVENVRTGTISATVSGTGQISASNQVGLTPKASGQITAIRVKPGQRVYQGQVIASVDVGTSGTDLQTAELQLQQAKTSNSSTITTSAESVANAQSNLTSAREAAVNALSSSYGSLDQVIVDLGDLYNSSGYLRPNAGNETLRADQNAGSAAYTDAQSALKSAEAQTSSITRSSSDAEIQSALTTAYTASKAVAKASSLTQTAVQYARTQKDTSTGSSQSQANAAWSTISSDVSSSNSQVTSLLSATQSITSAQNAIRDANTKVTDVTSGSGALDIRSAELNVQAKQQAYNDHFVTAPFAGVIATVTGNVGDQASGDTAIATLITTQEIADITLNEVDVATVQPGQKVNLSFDALSGLGLTGTVATVDGIGTVTQGVVSYGVKIALDKQDARIKPGMTVNADIQTATAKDVLTVPSSAIKTVNGRSSVEVFTTPLTMPTDRASAAAGILADTPPTRTPVQIGITDGTRTQITGGLAEGAQIVVRTVTGTAVTAKTSAASATSRTGGGGFGGGARIGG
jgi:HlyD family secretion protein